ncbi:C6 finger domain-containing protein [Colletotrichum chrysophilum]|uniref:C6 finger domain-containing protein n=1 Tax=Colletotrichum chrysophilum TaxID=1836956 RepID=A0AAD9ACQ8_9PEZI|nr:C6 finger domain-containing protein [Colletotrichum chrysophilum]
MRPITRSRNGCATCKRRKRKCDEARPECGPCMRRGLECEGYTKPLRWVNDTTSIYSVDGPETSRPTDRGLDTSNVSTPPSSSYRILNDQPQSRRLDDDHPLPPRPDEDGLDGLDNLFETFLKSGLGKLYNAETQSWIRPIFEDMASQSKALRIIGIAIQSYVDDGCDDLSVSSMERLDLALRTFRAELASQHNDIRASTAFAGLMVCSLCLLLARPFTMYVQLMANLYNLDAKMHLLEPGPGRDLPTLHMLESMCVMDLPLYVVGRVSPSIGLWKRFRKTQDSWPGGRIGGVEVGIGMPRSLIDVLADIPDGPQASVESRLWIWPGEIGEFIQCHLWDCWRFAGILEIRRRKRLQDGQAQEETQFAPNTGVIMCRLISAMDAIHKHIRFDLDREKYSLIQNGMVFPVTAASLEFRELGAHPEWKTTLESFREHLSKRDPFNFLKVIFELLDEAQASGTEVFDINEAARGRGVEVVLF